MTEQEDNLAIKTEEVEYSTLLNAAMCYAIHAKNDELLDEILNKGADPNFLYVNQSPRERKGFTKALVHFYTHGTKAIKEIECGSSLYL